MKKYVLFLIFILVLLGDLFIANAVKVNRELNKDFATSGYILKSNESSERYYFAENATYKESYNEKVVFEDVEGDKIVVDRKNFIHYGDNSISSFTKGVLINLDEIETEPITYYNFSEGKVLKRLANKSYIAKNLDKELEFTNLLWKISDSKYLLVGNPLKIIFSDETEKEIDGYLEIDYSDNEIVNIYNQEVNYETISADVYIQVGEDIKINLGNKIISKNDVNEMSLENMVINSDDNVNIVNLEEYKTEEEKEEEEENKEEKPTGQGQNPGSILGGNSSSVSGGNISANGGSVSIGGSESEGEEDNNNDNNDNLNDNNDNFNDNENNGGDIEIEVEDVPNVIAPKYTVTHFKVSATGMQAIVEIEDKEARLTSGTTTHILNNATGKIVYTLPETAETQIKIDTSSLETNTEYTLVMQASYQVDDVEYKNNFIYKIFRTSIFGITLEKDLFTDSSLAFNLKFDEDSTVSKLDIELVGTEQEIQEITNTGGSTERIQFENLTPDTEYTVKIKNVFIGNTSNANTYSYTFKTLKTLPKLKNEIINVEIDKRNSTFVLTIPGLEENVVESLNYQIYTIEAEEQETLIYSKITSDTQIKLPIDETIQRNTDYYCKVYATFYDNEKVVEYKIAYTETSFNMNSSPMPSIRFDEGGENGITFNTVQGSIIIEDNGNIVNPNAKLEIRYSSSTANIDDQGTITFAGIESSQNGKEKVIPINLNDLKANETYKFSVYATYDLYDGNEERYGYIGAVLITTPEPIPMIAMWSKNDEQGIDVSLGLESTANSYIEAQSLYAMDLALYLGQEGASNNPIATATLKDEGIGQFAATLKQNYYDNIGQITESIFKLSSAKVEEIVKNNKYCTIVITKARDYVSGKKFINEIPIMNNVYTYRTAATAIKNPVNSEKAITVNQIPKSIINNIEYDKILNSKKDDVIQENVLAEISKNSKINPDTTVAVTVSANISTELLNKCKYFEYFVYDSDGNLVAESGMIEPQNDKKAPTVLFLVADGTGKDVQDNAEDYTGLIRGNTYYYKYYAYMKTGEDENQLLKYPENVVVGESEYDYWEKNSKPKTTIKKQKANIIMYPSISTETLLSYKYKISDIDNTIVVENDNNPYFYHYYAGNAIFQNNKQLINIGENPNDKNGYWTVTFDLSNITEKNYELEVKIQQRLEKGKQETSRLLNRQKVEEIINIENPDVEFRENKGVSTTISFNKIDDEVKSKITKIEVNLINGNDIINIEKDKRELEKSEWNFDINYLDILKEKGDLVKGKTFEVKTKIYYINGQAGYDAIEQNGYVSYQTVDGDWLEILENGKKFIKLSESQSLYPIVYGSHQYKFDSERVLVNQNEKEVAWLNYSDIGLTRSIGNEENGISIIPKKVKLYESGIYSKRIEFSNSAVGINPPEGDLEILPTPTEVTIKINNLYTKGTIYETITDKSVYVDLYEEDYDGNEANDKLIGTYKISTNTGAEKQVTIKGLKNEKQYYCKLYTKDNDANVVYLYDFDKKTDEVKYEINLINKVEIQNIQINFIKNSIQTAHLKINHESSVNSGFKGFMYQICDEHGNIVNKPVEYRMTENEQYKTSTFGEFIVELENYNKDFEIFIKADRGSFFEYGKLYSFRIIPIIDDENYQTDQMKEQKYSYNIEEPVMLLYSRRVEAANGKSSYIEWSISVSDDNYLITEDGFEYEIYKNGNEEPIKPREKITLNNNYAIIRIDNKYDTEFEFDSKYTLKIYYKYYINNQDNNAVKDVEKVKEVKKLQNGIDIGNVSWKIEDNMQIKLKFYDSYELSKIKSMKCSIYDTSGTILNKVQEIKQLNIIEQNENLNDIHKSITFTTNYVFEPSKAYQIIIQFYGEDKKLIATFEPENPETYNQGE